MGCDDQQRTLKPTKFTKNGEECFNVTCIVQNGDTICYQNPGTPQAKILPKESVCYDVLKETAPPTPPPITTSPPDNKAPTYQFTFEFPDSLNKKFGFDPSIGSYQVSLNIAERRVSFFSVKKGGQLKTIVKISQAQRSLFTSFYMKISNSNLSFDSLNNTDSIELFENNSTTDTISIYGRYSSAFMEIPITIGGINRSGENKELICNSGTCDESVIAVCYDEKEIDSIRLYCINNSRFASPDTLIRNLYNQILKQAIVRIKGISKQNYTKNDWDKNKNGALDLFPIRDSVPLSMFEHDTLRALVEKDYNGCISCASADTSKQQPKVFILPSMINGNWLVMEPVNAGADSVVIQYSKELYDDEMGGIWRKVDFTLSNWDGSNSETFKINSIVVPRDGIETNRMIIKPYNGYKIKNNHLKNDVLVWKEYVLGFAYPQTSCAWVNGSINNRDILHEILHMRKLGALKHASKDTVNLMYPYTKPNYQLRYRELETDKVQENGKRQWDILN